MNKLKLKKTGKEVKMGEKLIKVVELFGIPVPMSQIEVNKTTLPDLIKRGIIVVEGSDSDIDITIEGAVQHLANRIGWNKENLEKYFNNLYKISPAAVFEIVLKEVAIMLDEKYSDHISSSKEIWVINKVNGRIQKLKDLSKIKSFKHFAAFRSLEDALAAKKVMAPALKDLYGK
jgi:hypothetical protein